MANEYIADKYVFMGQGFSEEQSKQLAMAENAQLDVSLIANKNYSYGQMRQIRLGLKHGIDCSIYLNEEYSEFRMFCIRKYLQKGLSSEVITAVNSEKDAKKSGYKHGVAKIFFTTALEGLNLFDYIGKNIIYKRNQLTLIKKAAKTGFPKLKEYLKARKEAEAINWNDFRERVLYYAKTKETFGAEYDYHQLFQLRRALKDGIDVAKYVTPAFNWRKIKEIRLGLMAGVDVSTYANVKYNSYIMREMRIALEKGIDLSKVKKRNENWQTLKKAREYFEEKCNFSKLTTKEAKEILQDIRIECKGICLE